MATLRQVRAALAETLAGEFEGTWNIEERPPGSLVPGSLIIAGFETEDQMLGGPRVSKVDVWAIVSAKDDSFMDLLDQVLDAEESSSIPAVVNADPTLGSVVDSCRIESVGSYGEREWAGVKYLGATARLEVFH